MLFCHVPVYSMAEFMKHMWQSRVEIEHYSVAYFGKLINTCQVYTARMSTALNGSSALQRFERSNAIEIRNGIMFDFTIRFYN